MSIFNDRIDAKYFAFYAFASTWCEWVWLTAHT